MPTEHGDGPAICRLEHSSRRGQLCSFLRCSGVCARRRVSHLPQTVQARANPLVLLPSIPDLSSRFALLSSLFYPHVFPKRVPVQAIASVGPNSKCVLPSSV